MNLSHGTQHRVGFMRGGRECLGMFIVHCCLLIYYIAVVTDGAEENNLCTLVHCAYDGNGELQLCFAVRLLITWQESQHQASCSSCDGKEVNV